MSSNIPKARQILAAALLSDDASVLRAAILEALALMTKHFIKPKAASKSLKMTPALARRLRSFCLQNPDMSVNEIGARFGVNGGRVSEAIHGRWDDPRWVAEYSSRTKIGDAHEV